MFKCTNINKYLFCYWLLAFSIWLFSMKQIEMNFSY